MKSDSLFIDEWLGDKSYKKLPLGFHSHFSFGQIFWTHAYYPHENLELWRPIFDPGRQTKTYASSFQIVAAGQDAFKRSIPLASPKLETNEELLVVRAKVRPVILLMPELPPLEFKNMATAERFSGVAVWWRKCLAWSTKRQAQRNSHRPSLSVSAGWNSHSSCSCRRPSVLCR